jgi:hypothetical protein
VNQAAAGITIGDKLEVDQSHQRRAAMRMRLVILAAVSLWICTTTASGEGVWSGPGMASCSQYAQHVRSQGEIFRNVYFSWAMGFMSGLNSPLMLSGMRATDLGVTSMADQQSFVDRILRSATFSDICGSGNEPLRHHARGTGSSRLATGTKILAPEKPPRGVCCHEVGHAFVAHSYGVPVQAIWVAFNGEEWHGGTDRPEGSEAHLHYMKQAAIFRAGKTAEEFFDCPANDRAWLRDFGEISSLLNRNGVLHELWSQIAEADELARPILETYRDKALKLIDRLVECGRVERPELLRLMDGPS